MDHSNKFEVIADLQQLKIGKLSKEAFLSKHSVESLKESINLIKKHQHHFYDASVEIFLITKTLELESLILELINLSKT